MDPSRVTHLNRFAIQPSRPSVIPANTNTARAAPYDPRTKKELIRAQLQSAPASADLGSGGVKKIQTSGVLKARTEVKQIVALLLTCLSYIRYHKAPIYLRKLIV